MKKLCFIMIVVLSGIISSYGQVGIGTTAPTQQLELTQSLKFPTTTSEVTGIIFKGDYSFLHDYRGPNALGYNTFLGLSAGNFTSGGTANYQGCNNTAIGYWALNAVTTGYANTAIGAIAMPGTTTGIENTAVGLQVMYNNTTGSRNTAFGYMANFYNQAGVNNTTIGYEAGKGTSLHSKTGNVFIGHQAGYFETGNNKLYIENSNSSSPLIGGDFSTNVAYINGSFGVGTTSPATTLHVAGTMRIADGTQGAGKLLISDANGTVSWTSQASINDGDWIISGSNLYANVSGNVGIGTTLPVQQLEITASMRMPATTSATAGVIYKGTSSYIHNFHGPAALDLNTFMGLDAGNFTMGGGSNYQGTNNTAVGFSSLHSVTTGFANSAVGVYTLTNNTSGYENTAIGLHSMLTNTSGIKNTAIGVNAGYGNTSGSNNTVIGHSANYYNETGGTNTIIGVEAGKGSSAHSKSGNIFIGYQAGINETGSNKLYIENSASGSPLIGGDFSSDFVSVNGRLGVGTSAPAVSALLDLTSTSTGLLLPRVTTSQRTAISGPTDGLVVYDTDADAEYLYRNGAWSPGLNGANGWAITGNSGTSASTHFLGTTDNVPLKFRVNNMPAGMLEQGVFNTGFGYLSLSNLTTGQQNTAIGYKALETVTTGSINVAIGSMCGTDPTYSNTVSIGYMVYADASNRAEIGNSSMSFIGGQVGWSTISDGRVKKNISENVPGLDFILNLRPVSYQFDLGRLDQIRGTAYPPDAPAYIKQAREEQEARIYTGFVAQEVETAAKRCGFDFSGIQTPVNDRTPYSLRYAEFVVPLVKAVQELKAENDELKARLEALENKLKIKN